MGGAHRRFSLVQSALLAVWIALHVTAHVATWDPYPFMPRNLVLSFKAAHTAPIIMTSQQRFSEVDRRRAKSDYRINVKREWEIEALHARINALREREIMNTLQMTEKVAERREPSWPGPCPRT